MKTFKKLTMLSVVLFLIYANINAIDNPKNLTNNTPISINTIGDEYDEFIY